MAHFSPTNDNWFIEHLDFILAIVIAVVVAIGVPVGYIPANQIPATTLGVIVTLTIYLAVKNYRLSAKVDSISKSLLGVERKMAGMTSARILSDSEDFFRTLSLLMTDQSKLDVTYFSPIPPTDLPGTEVSKYWKTLAIHLKKSSEFRVRRIMTIESQEKLKWARQTITDSKNSSNYHLAAIGTEQPFPLLNIVIIDGRHTVVFSPHMQAGDASYLYVDDAEVAEAVERYFSDLWRVATKLKLGNHIYDEAFDEIEQQLAVGISNQ